MLEFNEILIWLEQNPEWVAFGIIGASFIESFALIGIIIPGVVLLAVIAGLASTSLSVYEVVLLAYLASFFSDITSYFIGFSLRNSLAKIWPFNKYPKLLANGKAFFQKYGMIGLFIGKFIGPVRPLLPITAGSLSMNIKSFIIIEVFSCFIWALIYTLPGYYAGKSMNFENNNPLESLWILAGIVVIFILIRYFRKKIKTQ